MRAMGTRQRTSQRRRWGVAAGLLVAAVGVVGCGSEAERGIDNMAKAPSASRAVACRSERDQLTTALESYRLQVGADAAVTDDLVRERVVAQPPTYYGVADGRLVLTAAGRTAACPEPPPG